MMQTFFHAEIYAISFNISHSVHTLMHTLIHGFKSRFYAVYTPTRPFYNFFIFYIIVIFIFQLKIIYNKLTGRPASTACRRVTVFKKSFKARFYGVCKVALHLAAAYTRCVTGVYDDCEHTIDLNLLI